MDPITHGHPVKRFAVGSLRGRWEPIHLGQKDIGQRDSVNSQPMSFIFPKIVRNAVDERMLTQSK